MNTRLKSWALLCAATLCAAPAGQAQFQTINAGAVGTNANDKLAFVNGASFDVGSGYALPLVYTSITNFASTNAIYSSTNLQFWSLSATNPSGSAAIGSYIVCEILSVTGPSGGILSYWEQNWRTPTYYFPVGESPVVGSNRFDVSDISLGAGLGDGDPVGRIPTRRFTVNKAGEYFMTVKLFDVSTNTAAWGPVHVSSDPLTIRFTTTVDLAMTRIRLSNEVATLTFKQSGLTNVYVEANTNLTASADWLAIAGPFTNAPAFTNATTLNVTNSALARFFRLRAETP